MSESIDRKTYLKRVGIDSSTLSEWVREGVIEPRAGRPGWQQVFTDEDVAFGCEFKDLREKHRGKYSRRQLVDILNGDLEVEEVHSPPGAPPPGAGANPDH